MFHDIKIRFLTPTVLLSSLGTQPSHLLRGLTHGETMSESPTTEALRRKPAQQHLLAIEYTASRMVLPESLQHSRSAAEQRCLKHFCRYDFFARQEAVVGQHMAGVRCVEWLPEQSLLATGSWDRTLSCWDPRIPQVAIPPVSI